MLTGEIKSGSINYETALNQQKSLSEPNSLEVIKLLQEITLFHIF